MFRETEHWKRAEQIAAAVLERVLGLPVRLTPGSGSGRRRLDLEVVQDGRVALRVEVKSTRSPERERAARRRARQALSRYHSVDAPLEAVVVFPSHSGWAVHRASCPSCQEEHITLLFPDGEIRAAGGRCLRGMLRKRGVGKNKREGVRDA